MNRNYQWLERKCGLELFLSRGILNRSCVLYVIPVFTWKKRGRCYLPRFHGRFASNLKWSLSKQVFSACRSSFDIMARIEYPFKLFLSILIFKMYVYTLMVRNFGFENRVRWQTGRLSFILVRMEMYSDWFTRIYRSILAEQFCSKIEIWHAR